MTIRFQVNANKKVVVYKIYDLASFGRDQKKDTARSWDGVLLPDPR